MMSVFVRPWSLPWVPAVTVVPLPWMAGLHDSEHMPKSEEIKESETVFHFKVL